MCGVHWEDPRSQEISKRIWTSRSRELQDSQTSIDSRSFVWQNVKKLKFWKQGKIRRKTCPFKMETIKTSYLAKCHVLKLNLFKTRKIEEIIWLAKMEIAGDQFNLKKYVLSRVSNVADCRWCVLMVARLSNILSGL